MSRVIFKMTFKHPNYKDTVSKNMAHVNYIATRSGVDKTITEADLKKELDKGIDNVMSENEKYMQYIDERPRSHGLFGQDGIEDLREVQQEIEEVSSYVWRAIISLKEDDAKNLEYIDKERWQDLLRKKVPDIASEMGIRIDNLRWVGAVHMEKGHPHAHIMMWEKSPEKALGVIRSKSLDNIRKSLTDEVFEEERLKLLLVKNSMRDLIRDLANDDISQAARLIREVKDTRNDIDTIVGGEYKTGVPPKIYTDVERELIKRIQNLSEMMPEKGRIALKFMPENVKEEVRNIADYLLQKPAFSAALAKNLMAVEELTRFYTGKEEDIGNARDNALKDIKDRVCQVILKGAVECKRENKFYIDNELAHEAVETIKRIDNKIDLNPEHVKVLGQVGTALIRSGLNNETVAKHLYDYASKENLGYKFDYIKSFVDTIKQDSETAQGINVLSSSKKVEFYLQSLKLSGFEEKDAFEMLRKAIKSENTELEKKFSELGDQGLVYKAGSNYRLTNKGIDEFLKEKKLDVPQKEIIKAIESQEVIEYKKIIENENVFNSLIEKDPEEVKISKFDIKLREEFGENNKLTINEFEARIFEKYSSDSKDDLERAEKEFEIYKHRIDKLTLNGYIKYNRESGIYSFTEEAAKELSGLNEKMEFGRYDANVVLKYIDDAPNNILDSSDLKSTLEKEIVNQTAQKQYEKFSAIVSHGQGKEFIGVDSDGNITATEEGKKLSYELNEINRFFAKSNNSLTEEKLKEIFEEDFKEIKEEVNKLSKLGLLAYDGESFSLTPPGVTEYLNIKELDDTHETIISLLNESSPVSIDSLIENENLIDKLHDKDPEDFQISRYDYKVKEEFGNENKLVLDDAKTRIFENYDVEKDEELQKAQNEFALLKGRVEKLELYGYAEYDDKSNSYSLTDEALDEIKSIGYKMEFGRYDATTTLGYIDRANDGILNLNDLKSILEREVINQGAKEHFELFQTVLNDGSSKEWILVSDDGKMTASEVGKKLSIEMSKLYRYFIDSQEGLSEETLEKLCVKQYGKDEATKQFNNILVKINDQVSKGNIIKSVDGTYAMDPNKLNACKMLYQIYKAGGAIQREELKEVLEKIIPNKEAQKQFKYLEKRLNFLKSEGYLRGGEGEYKITTVGEEKRKDILMPQRVFLKKEISYLESLGFLKRTPEGYISVKNEENYKNKSMTGDEKSHVHKSNFSRKMENLIYKSYNKINLNKYAPTQKKIRKIQNRIRVQVKKGNVIQKLDGSYSIDPFKKDIRDFLQQIRLAGGILEKASLKAFLEKNTPNFNAERQYKYLLSRLEFLKNEGYLTGSNGVYIITSKGEEKRKDILIPERGYLTKELKYLEKLGLIEKIDSGYKITKKYQEYINAAEVTRLKGEEQTSGIFSKDIVGIIEKTQDNVNIDKIQRANQRIATGKYINNVYGDLKTEYQEVRSSGGVQDLSVKTLSNLSTALILSGMSIDDVKTLIHIWNHKSNSSLDNEKINSIVDNAAQHVNNDKAWNRVTIISKKDWEEMFKLLGVKDPPEWMYKSENWRGISLISVAHEVWKAAWATMERNRLQTEAQVAIMKERLLEDHELSKEALKVKIRNARTNELYKEGDLE